MKKEDLVKLCEQIDAKLAQICVQGDGVIFLARARSELAVLSKGIDEMGGDNDE